MRLTQTTNQPDITQLNSPERRHKAVAFVDFINEQYWDDILVGIEIDESFDNHESYYRAFGLIALVDRNRLPAYVLTDLFRDFTMVGSLHNMGDFKNIMKIGKYMQDVYQTDAAGLKMTEEDKLKAIIHYQAAYTDLIKHINNQEIYSTLASLHEMYLIRSIFPTEFNDLVLSDEQWEGLLRIVYKFDPTELDGLGNLLSMLLSIRLLAPNRFNQLNIHELCGSTIIKTLHEQTVGIGSHVLFSTIGGLKQLFGDEIYVDGEGNILDGIRQDIPALLNPLAQYT